MGERIALDGAAEVVKGHLVWGSWILWQILGKVCHMQWKALVVWGGFLVFIFGRWDDNRICVSKESHLGC